MNDRPAAIRGTFSDFKLIRTRKLCQIVIEVPIEEADAALDALGGLPRSDVDRWVALARLNAEAPPAKPVAAPHRPFHELAYQQQAALKSNDAPFAAYMHADPGADCAQAIRYACDVSSRADIKPGTPAGDKWIALLRGYERAK